MKRDYIQPELQAYATMSAQVLASSTDLEMGGVGIEGIGEGSDIDLD